MKNILILIVFAAVFLHFYPQPKITEFYNETRASLEDGFSEFSDTSVRLKSEKILTDLTPELDRFSPAEVKTLKEITASRKNVKLYYEDYCRNKKRSTVFHPTNQAKICRTISQYESML